MRKRRSECSLRDRRETSQGAVSDPNGEEMRDGVKGYIQVKKDEDGE